MTKILFIFLFSVLLKGSKAFKWFFNPAQKVLVAPTPQEDPPFMRQVQLIFANFRVDLRPFCKKCSSQVDLWPQRGHHNLQPSLLQGTTGSTFLIRLMHLILRFLPPPICFPQFPCQPSSLPLFVNFRLAGGGREDTS